MVSTLLSREEQSAWLRLALVPGVKPRDQDPVWRFIGDGHRWLGGREYLHTVLGEKNARAPREFAAR